MAHNTERARNLSGFFGLAVVAVYGLVCLTVAYISGRAGVEFTLCPMKRITGYPCPTCGGTRAALELLQGHPAEAFWMNPLVFASFIVVPLVYLGWRRVPAVYRQKIRGSIFTWVILGAAALANWVYLIIDGR